MLKISDAVRSIIKDDDIALQAMQLGLLNMSAYAQQILPEVETKTFKEIKKGTIVVALSRLAEEINNDVQLRPKVVLDSLSIKSPLCIVTFNKTPNNTKQLNTLYPKLKIRENSFFTVTQSTSEITIIAPQSLFAKILSHFDGQPKIAYENKVGITIGFSDKYLAIPNVLYTIQATLAVHKINFIEIVSTYTEFCFILEKESLDEAMGALRRFFG